jgi:hypothetical protein
LVFSRRITNGILNPRVYQVLRNDFSKVQVREIGAELEFRLDVWREISYCIIIVVKEEEKK